LAGTKIRITRHGAEQAWRRDIDLGTVVDTVRDPKRVVGVRHRREIRQSPTADGRVLVRVVVDASDEYLTVVTMYQTSKIAKYQP